MRNLLCLISALLMATPLLAQGDGQFDWPLASENDDGELVFGLDHYIMQNFYNTNGPFPGQAHAGADISQKTTCGGNHSDTADDPVYAVADGTVFCTNENIYDARQSYPGKVVLVEHDLPDGSTVYSLYAHLNFCDTESDTECVDEGDTVTRGDQIGTVLPWPQSEGGTGNSHLHFEIRDFQYWDYSTDEPTTEEPSAENAYNIGCAGRGYAPSGADELYEGYFDPVAFIMSRRPPLAEPVQMWTEGERNVRSAPTTEGENVVGRVAAGAEVTATAIVRDDAFDCVTTDCYQDTNDFEPECDWWYRIEFEDVESGETLEGYVNATNKGSYCTDIAVGEQNRLAEAWQTPEDEPGLYYYFSYDDAADDRTIINLGEGVLLPAQVEGSFNPISIRPPIPEYVIELDGATGYAEVGNASGLASDEPFQVQVELQRLANDSDDVIAGQWDPADEDRQRWLLTFSEETEDGLAVEGGELQFRVRLENGEEAVARWVLPDCDYLETWVKVQASYDPEEGLALFFDGRRVASAELDAPMASPEDVALRIGSDAADAGSDPDRFDGGLISFRLWGEVSANVCDLLDLTFVIDDTGSMWDDILQVRESAAEIIASINDICVDVRLALVTFNDPAVRVRLALTASDDAALAAINALSANGGGDFPEHVLGGLAAALGLDWREAARRAIILMGDAPPKDPEPGTGLTLEDIVEAAGGTAVPTPITAPAPKAALTSAPEAMIGSGLSIPIYSIHIGNDAGTREAFRQLAEGTGGELILSANASEIVAAILDAIGDIGTGGNLPPDVSMAAPSVGELWPPNHKLHEVAIENVTDPEGDEVTITVTGITQDEAVEGPGRKHSPDGVGIGESTVELRAERDGGGNGGRVYEVSFTATDSGGASTDGSVFVCVPHDQGVNNACVDDGQVYDSTVP